MAISQDPQEATLCKACGMCCRGAWFANIKITVKEVENLKSSTKLKPYTKKDKFYSPQPCPELKDNGCSIYINRPVDCHNYECELLVNLNTNKKSLDECFKRVDTLKGKYSDIVTFLINQNKDLKVDSLNVRLELGIIIQSMIKNIQKNDDLRSMPSNDKIILIYDYIKFVNDNFRETRLLQKMHELMGLLWLRNL